MGRENDHLLDFRTDFTENIVRSESCRVSGESLSYIPSKGNKAVCTKCRDVQTAGRV